MQKQRQWAFDNHLASDARGYLSRFEDNLFQTINERTRQAFEKGSGSELIDKPRSPAKMKALHSSSALAVNFFDFWVGVDSSALSDALGIGPEEVDIRFEEQYPTGLPGNPPNLDVVLERKGGQLIAIESKFTEWLTPKSVSKVPYKEKYFQNDSRVWDKVGLPATQLLAESMQKGELFFRHLDAVQLAKHALGLATNLGTNFRLFYAYFDGWGGVSAAHKKEIEIFSDHVGDELGFRSMTYQNLLSSLENKEGVFSEYTEYLRTRYS